MEKPTVEISNNSEHDTVVVRYITTKPQQRLTAKDVLLCARLIENSGSAAAFAVDEFFHADFRNPHTRRTYRGAINQFLAFVQTDMTCLAQITPAHVGRYFDQLTVATATKKLHL